MHEKLFRYQKERTVISYRKRNARNQIQRIANL
jgi:hypothetical protein